MFTHLSRIGMRRSLVAMAFSALALVALIGLFASFPARANNAAQNRVGASSGQPSATHDSSGGTIGSAQPGSVVTGISIIDFAFEPRVVTITAGSSVRWTNNGTLIHTSTSDTGVWDSGDIKQGDMFTETFDTPGTYAYHCMHHPDVMRAAVVVLPPVQPPTAVSIAGSTEITVNTAYTFTATVSPISATLPITFYWQATGQLPVTDTDRGVTDTITFTWPSGTTGAQIIIATAANGGASATGTYIAIIAPKKVYLPVVIKSF